MKAQELNTLFSIYTLGDKISAKELSKHLNGETLMSLLKKELIENTFISNRKRWFTTTHLGTKIVESFQDVAKLIN